MHLLYLLCFNVICLISKAYVIDEHKQKIARIDALIQKQTVIESKLKAIYEQENRQAFNFGMIEKQTAALKVKSDIVMQKKMMDIMKEVNGDAMARGAQRAAWIKKGIFALCIGVFLFRQYFFKLLKMF